MINLLVCLIVALIIAAALMAVVRAILALPGWAGFAPYGGVIYALVVLLVVLVIVSYCFGFPSHGDLRLR